jgi:hypothetical protein
VLVRINCSLFCYSFTACHSSGGMRARARAHTSFLFPSSSTAITTRSEKVTMALESSSQKNLSLLKYYQSTSLAKQVKALRVELASAKEEQEQQQQHREAPASSSLSARSPAATSAALTATSSPVAASPVTHANSSSLASGATDSSSALQSSEVVHRSVKAEHGLEKMSTDNDTEAAQEQTVVLLVEEEEVEKEGQGQHTTGMASVGAHAIDKLAVNELGEAGKSGVTTFMEEETDADVAEGAQEQHATTAEMEGALQQWVGYANGIEEQLTMIKGELVSFRCARCSEPFPEELAERLFSPPPPHQGDEEADPVCGAVQAMDERGE